MVGEVATTGWRSTQAYPSEIHVELLKNGLIPDPYRGFAEHEVQWVGEVEWLYKCTFDLKSGEGRHTQAELEFLGLDTVCDVYLVSAESPITCWHHDSRTYNRTMNHSGIEQHVPDPCCPHLTDGLYNTLLLHFNLPRGLLNPSKNNTARYAQGRQTSEIQAGSTCVRPSMIGGKLPGFHRIPPHLIHCSWDWGPELMTCGPFRPIILRRYTARIGNV